MTEFMLPKDVRKTMLATYLSRRQLDLVRLRNSLEMNIVEDFNSIGHQLLGNARNFGFAELEPLAQQMERLSSKDLSQAGPVLLKEFSNWIEKTKSLLAT